MCTNAITLSLNSFVQLINNKIPVFCWIYSKSIAHALPKEFYFFLDPMFHNMKLVVMQTALLFSLERYF